MALYLHLPSSNAHIEDLRDRLLSASASAQVRSVTQDQEEGLIDRLVNVVRAMDQGTITPKEALEFFARHRVPGFSFGRWLVEMVDEGIYLEELYNDAA